MNLYVKLGIAVLLALGWLVLRFGLRRWIHREVGERALARQPDHIRLVSALPGTWKDGDATARLAAPLLSQGFRDAGTYTVSEMPGVVMRLLAHEGEAFYAAIYEHPRAGHWLDIYCRYLDGTHATFSTARATGLDPRPGLHRVNAPGTEPGALLARARAERPGGALRPARASTAAADFTSAYADEMAWRRSHGISEREVAAVAAHRRSA